jgi:death-on-curing protein
VLKPDDLESASKRPASLWHYEHVEDVVVLAVRLLFAVAQSHAFIQGNKRTGFVAAVIFLEANGWIVDPKLDSDKLGEAIVDVLCDRTSEAVFCDWIADFIQPL